ncbi:MAG: hypothetical protein HN509_14425 [Halobacteriovoraceae bacterium]|jgi:hypothetical protein|nr:hypothetical protein [Halobacteriovoraceae bacterium]MBT5093565.1 hypothetical protein [Halobacteriovoraceae bacterium]
MKKLLLLLLFSLPLIGLIYLGANNESSSIDEGIELQNISELKKDQQKFKKEQFKLVKRAKLKVQVVRLESAATSKLMGEKVITKLPDAIDKEEQWSLAKNEFLTSELNLSDSEIEEVVQLAGEALEVESALISNDIVQDNLEDESFQKNYDKLMVNRIQYEDQIAELMGEDNWQRYVKFYRKYWNYSEDLALNKMYQPLK